MRVFSLPIMALITALLALTPFTHAAYAAPAAPATAVSPGHVTAAREVLRLLRVKESIAPMVAQLAAMVSEQIEQWKPAAEQQPEVDKTIARLNAALATEINWSNLEADYVVLYTESFSEAELKDIARIDYQKATAMDDSIKGTIPVLDPQYGNVWTNIPRDMVRTVFKDTKKVHVTLKNGARVAYTGELTIEDTFAGVPKGKPLLYFSRKIIGCIFCTVIQHFVSIGFAGYK